MSVRFSSTRMQVAGTGHALPGPAIDNELLLAELARHCSPARVRLGRRLVDRLGIRSRHVSRDLSASMSGASPGATAPELCCTALQTAASEQAMDVLIGHTATPHTLLPSNIAWVSELLEHSGPHLELRQACTGFASALAIAAGMLADDPGARIGIVGSETGSPHFRISDAFADHEQLLNFVQMGDGAGAIVLTSEDGSNRSVISNVFVGQIGNGREPGIRLIGGGSSQPECAAGFPYFRHDARAVRTHGELLLRCGIDAIRSQGMDLGDFDWIIPHQANGRMAALFEARFPATRGKVFVTADTLGNMGSAAIWTSFDRLRRSGRLVGGERVLVLGAEASKYLYGGFVYTH